jgi:predicted enzyme related to lactoylglutathione lyase
MYVVKKYPNGVFCWIDLTTTDLEAAKAFYGGLFGWEFEDMPTDMGTVYTMCQIDGKNVAGMGPMPQDMQAQGVPPIWMSYVKHDNVDAIAAKVTESSGALVMPPMEVMESGRMLMATDPTGAVFGVWQPKNHIGAQLVNMPNALVWDELQTKDVEAAKGFYTAVFGWGSQVDASGYVTFQVEGRTQAGMMQIDESWGDVPSNWAVYFMISDVHAAVDKVKELGGNILVQPTKAGEMGEFAVVQDPQGGAFTIMQFYGPVDVPPGIE